MFAAVLGSNVFKPSDWHKSFHVQLGLDLSGGTSVTLQAITPGGKQPTSGEMTKAVQIMQDRVQATGLTGSTVGSISARWTNGSEARSSDGQ